MEGAFTPSSPPPPPPPSPLKDVFLKTLLVLELGLPPLKQLHLLPLTFEISGIPLLTLNLLDNANSNLPISETNKRTIKGGNQKV